MFETVDTELLVYYHDAMSSGLQFQGLNVAQYEKPIRKLIQRTGAKTLLDYGSGLGHQYSQKGIHKRWGVAEPTCYDPAVTKFSKKPEGVFDGVICSDVLEHVPEPLVDALIEELFSYSTKFVWASVCARPAKKTFPDGRNMHVTLHPLTWWQLKFFKHAAGRLHMLVETP